MKCSFNICISYITTLKVFVRLAIAERATAFICLALLREVHLLYSCLAYVFQLNLPSVDTAYYLVRVYDCEIEFLWGGHA